jgi:hypothetical protein
VHWGAGRLAGARLRHAHACTAAAAGLHCAVLSARRAAPGHVRQRCRRLVLCMHTCHLSRRSPSMRPHIRGQQPAICPKACKTGLTDEQ